MKCDEVQSLHDPHLDSELDTRTALEIEQHLKSCPDCARFFTEAASLDSRLTAGLNRGLRTAALWEQIERSVATANSATAGPKLSSGVEDSAGWRVGLYALLGQLRAGCGHSSGAWAALVAAWVVIFALHFAARETGPPLLAGPPVPSASEVHSALLAKQVLMAELAGTAAAVPADKPKPVQPSPRGERRSEIRNA